MPQGLQVWDASGNLIVDLSTRLSRLIAIINVNLTDGSQSFPGTGNTLVGILADFAADNPTPDDGTGILPTVSVSGSTVSWTYNDEPGFLRMQCRILVLGY